jgi:hypothetical protein
LIILDRISTAFENAISECLHFQLVGKLKRQRGQRHYAVQLRLPVRGRPSWPARELLRALAAHPAAQER